jgi:Domain of unknown function (DUF4258)
VRIGDIIRAMDEAKVVISDHADEEAKNDRLSFDEIYFSVNHGEIIEEYPTDRPYPSCLVYGDTFGGDPVHSVWGYNERTKFAVLITVYRPDPGLWMEDWKTRR